MIAACTIFIACVMMEAAMHSFLSCTAKDINDEYGANRGIHEGPCCFGGPRTFRINYVDKFAKFALRSICRRRISRTPNLVADMLYSEKLLGPLGGNATMQQILATPGVLSSLIVKVNYPWNYAYHADNSVVLIYYLKEFHQPGPYTPTCVKVLGRALSAIEIRLLQEELGVQESNIQGNGINECGKCWHANPNDDDEYTFTIPSSVILKGAEDVDFVTINDAQVQLSTLTGGLVVDCKQLMDCIIMGFYSADIEGYERKI